MRDVIHKTGARFTHPGAEEIYTAQKDRMDAYAENWGQLADRVWEEEYIHKQPEEVMEVASQSEVRPAL